MLQQYKIDEYGKEILLQDDKHQVMMEWEKPYMESCINKLQPKGDVLEIGFGMGILSDAIQLKKPKSPFTAKELAIAAAAYSLGATGGGKKGPSAHPTKRKSKGKTLSDIEKQERKKKDRAARYERISKNPARTGPRSNKKT